MCLSLLTTEATSCDCLSQRSPGIALLSRKDKDISTNVPDLELPVCRNGSYCARRATMGHRSTTEQAGPCSKATGSAAGENAHPLPGSMTEHIFRKALEHAGSKTRS